MAQSKPQLGQRLMPPAQLDVIADKVLAYKPKAKSKPAKNRARRAKKIQKRESST